jgi:hypothetical protein
MILVVTINGIIVVDTSLYTLLYTFRQIAGSPTHRPKSTSTKKRLMEEGNMLKMTYLFI